MLPITVLGLESIKGDPPPWYIDPKQKLAMDMGRHTHVPVSYKEAFLRYAPEDCFLVAFQGPIEDAIADCPSERRSEIARRTVFMEDKWPRLYQYLEEYSFAAAVDPGRFWLWSRDPDHERGGGLFGLISVAERAGMEYQSGSNFGSERYGRLYCRNHCRDLPSLLVHYLTVYAEMGLHLPQPNGT